MRLLRFSRALPLVDGPDLTSGQSAPRTVAVKIGPPPAPAKKTCTPPDEGQWAALSCKAGRIRVEHFDSERAANEHLAELDGPEWGYTAQVTDLYRAEKSA